MDISQAVILGIIEGITEFLPISSTGHLILASSLLGIAQDEFVKTFEIAIQLGAVLAVVALYWRSFLDTELLKKILVAFIPTGIIGLGLYHIVKTYLLGNNAVVLASLFMGGVILIAFERWHGAAEPGETGPTMSGITYRQSFIIGVCQAVALVPGISRSGATVIGGMMLGITRTVIVEFSFLLAVPTMLAATGLDLLNVGTSFAYREWLMLSTGFLVSFVVAAVAVRWLVTYVRGHSFTGFGVYRIILSVLFAAFLLY